MGMNMSSMGMGIKGVSMSQILSLVTDKLYDQFVEKDIKDFNDFHHAILDTFSTINMALPGKHYDPPSIKDATDIFDQWKKETNEEERKKIWTEFMKKNVNMNKVDESMIITAIVAPSAAMVAKRTGQTLPQLKLMKSVPDVVFVPSATVVALVAVKILRYMFKGKKTIAHDDHDRQQNVPQHDHQEPTDKTAPQNVPESSAKPVTPAAPPGEEQPKHAPPNFYCALCDRYH